MKTLHLAILLFLLTGTAFSQASSFSKGQEAFARGDYSTAIRMFQEARKQASNPAESAKILDRLAYTYEKQGGFYESIPIREEHLHLFGTRPTDPEGKARAQLKLGSALYEDFRYGESAKHIQGAYDSVADLQSDFAKVTRFLAVCNTFALHAVLGNEKEFVTSLGQLEKSAEEVGTVPDTFPYDDQDLDLIFRSTFRVGSVLRYWLPKMGPELAKEKTIVQSAVIQLYTELGQVALTELPDRRDAVRMWAASLLELAVTYREVGE
ncbi:MAG: hypothetical protein HYU64_12145 [Armatimonadetes bacterium]|nr:hypothetical protein [Armatimonadota bacterium]